MTPFRDELGAAYERAERLARELASLQLRLAAVRFDWLQWTLVGLIAACAMTIEYLFASAR